MKRILFTSSDIQKRVKEIAERISFDYRGAPLTLVVVMNGGFMFAADLARLIDRDPGDELEMRFCGLKSYKVKDQLHTLTWTMEFNFRQLRGQHVVIVEDLVDSGRTLDYLIREIRLHAESVHVAVVLDKKANRKLNVPITYACFKVADIFVAGYGMDVNNKFRNCGYIFDATYAGEE